ncbi:potassium transporter TrkG [Mycoplasma sp. ATU-Cv-508]|uniref:potassium transporter TrkG n=1 Tax=Mycoplasma sp. ATU-Cv-508 TaxID=2048001 RepID=UPI000FDDF6D6
MIGALILYMPISQQEKVEVTFLDALFVAASAFSDTGLVTVPTYSTWSYFGQAVIAVLILTGGIGLFSLKVYFFNILLRRPISYNTNMTLSTERGSNKVGGSPRIIKNFGDDSFLFHSRFLVHFNALLLLCSRWHGPL